MKRQDETPKLTVDIIIRMGREVVLIKRLNPPFGWAIPGGFVNCGESLEQAALREAQEETSLELDNLQQFRAYSDPDRDPRGHTVSVVFTAEGKGIPRAASDAKEIGVFSQDRLPDEMAFDHRNILEDYFSGREGTSGHP